MAVNLVSLVMQFLTPDMTGRIATALGLDRNLVQTAINAAVPGLLAGFGGVATQPNGAQRLVDAAKQQTNSLGNVASALSEGGQTSLIDRGSQLLSTLLGARDQTALAEAVAKFAGLGQGKGSSLLGMLAPLVMGTIAQQQGTRLEASGIAGLLASQKDNIAAALPAGFGKLLGGTGLLDSLGDAARTATAAGRQTAREAASASSSRNWLYWLIPVLAIAAFAIYWFSRPAEQVVQQGVTAVQNLTVGGLDLGKQVNDSVTNLRSTLAGITDAASARASLPKLQDVTAQVDKVDGMLGQLSAEQRKLLTGIVSPLIPSLNQLFDKVLAIPGVAEVLKPTIDVLKAKLATLTA
jgi:hypothetical protein